MFSDNLLFPSFMRTVPDDRLQAMAIVQLLIEFDWKWLVIVGSDDEYGRQGLQEISTLSENTSLCIAYKGRIPVYTDPYAEIKIILDNIEITEAGVVVVFSGVISAEIFFKEVSHACSRASLIVKIVFFCYVTVSRFVSSFPFHLYEY